MLTDGPALLANNLTKAFSGALVLDALDLRLEQGENVVVIGPSGTGKSVLIKCLVRLMLPDAGDVLLFDKELYGLNAKDLNKLRRQIGFLFQSAALYDSMSVRENVGFPLRHSIYVKKEQSRRVDRILDRVGLTAAADKMPAQLSGGMRKRVGLARTLILEPKLIFYDEPTTGLDPITALEISRLIKSIQEEYGASSLIITHDKVCTRITADRVLVLKNGRFVANGTCDELAAVKDEWISAFFAL